MISLIVATSENNVIGHLNKIPWYLPRDLKHFADITKGHTVVMGRNTYESIIAKLGKPLPNRKNIVVSRQKDFVAPGCAVIADANAFLKDATTETEEIFVIGGSQLYALALPYAKKLYRTVVHTHAEGDAFFPETNAVEWKLESEESYPKDEKNEFDITYYVYRRKA